MDRDILDGGNGCALLWHATSQAHGGEKTVEFDGLDLVLVEGGRISRNEVYFDRSVLAVLPGPS